MLLLNVCNTWTDIALSTPALWADIRVVFPRAEGFPELLGIWLQRAHTLPLFMSFSNDFDEGVAPIVRVHAQRLKQLELCHDMDVGDEDSDGTINLFGCSSPGPLPLLDTLTFRRSSHLNGLAYSRAQILELLRQAPNLVQCTLDSVEDWPSGIQIQPSQGPLVLPNLRSLLFTELGLSYPSNDGILRDLTIPRLETLSLSMYVSGDDILAFLKRSSPPLRELVFGDGFTSDDVTQLDECLRLVPTLVRFDLYWPFTRDMGAVFNMAFAESVLGFPPNLRSLTVRTYSGDTIPNSFLEALLHLLTGRHLQITELKIILSTWLSDLKEGIRIGFQRLVADGMEVYIGTEAQNFISLDP
ncbi:hypothetical protein B0H11DRAFT_2116125 [Mycena galericulata]|nr:hypothetical protein B0H11DRAFT_2116125 [Mycena galericulata]